MCLLCSACSVYFHVSCKKRVHCSLGGKTGEGDYIAAMFLKVLQIQSSVGGKGIYQCGNLLHTLWHDINSRLSGEKFNMIQVNTFLSLNPRPQPRGESLVTVGKSLELHKFLGRVFHPPIILQKTPFVIPTLEPLSLQHDDSNFLALQKLAISSQLQAMNLLWSPG